MVTRTCASAGSQFLAYRTTRPPAVCSKSSEDGPITSTVGPVKLSGVNMIDARLVTAVHNAGREIRAWGANRDAQSIDRLIALGVDAIGSDRPDLAIERVRAIAHRGHEA